MEAVRVPPSASITSASIFTLIPAKAPKSNTERRLRPMRRWISTLRESVRFRSRALRPRVEPGNIAYSAVSQPLFSASRKGGTEKDAFAVTSTRVCPHSTKQDPPEFGIKPGVIRISRNSPGRRPSIRFSIKVPPTMVYTFLSYCNIP